jgi:hypothetical protein
MKITNEPIENPIQAQMELARRQAGPPGGDTGSNDDEMGVAVHREVRALVVLDHQGRPTVVVEETSGVVIGSGDNCVVAVQRQLHVIGGGDDDDVTPQAGARQLPAISNVAYHSGDDDVQQQQTVAANHDDDDDGSCCSCCCCVRWTLVTIFCLPFLPCILCCKYCDCCKCDD